MALNTSPSFASGKSAIGGNSLASQVAGQRAAKRRAMPNKGGMMSSPGMMRPNPTTNAMGAGIAARRGGPGMFGSSMRPAPPAIGYGPGGSMGIPSSPQPMRVQAPPLMAEDSMPGPMMGGGMVANTAPEFDTAGAAARLKERMGGNTGITGGRFGRGDLQMMY